MAELSQDKPIVLETDAVVIRGALSGTATAIHLARSGFRVICIDPRKKFPNT